MYTGFELACVGPVKRSFCFHYTRVLTKKVEYDTYLNSKRFLRFFAVTTDDRVCLQASR